MFVVQVARGYSGDAVWKTAQITPRVG
jgi:hypothetical protein